jgi:hypothetical protein
LIKGHRVQHLTILIQKSLNQFFALRVPKDRAKLPRAFATNRLHGFTALDGRCFLHHIKGLGLIPAAKSLRTAEPFPESGYQARLAGLTAVRFAARPSVLPLM